MDAWIIISLILAIMVVVMFFLMSRKNAEIAMIKKQEEREWTLKTALEKTFNLPTVSAGELGNIETQLNRLMNSSGADEEVEEKMRLAVMELYAQKAEQKGQKGAPQRKASGDTGPISGRGR